MLFDRFATLAQLSDLRERIQRLEMDNASLRARVESDALHRHSAAQTAAVGPIVGWAIESFARAVSTPARRGRAGGLARARQASHLGQDGPMVAFMAHEDWEQIEREYPKPSTCATRRAALRAQLKRHVLLMGRFYRSENNALFEVCKSVPKVPSVMRSRKEVTDKLIASNETARFGRHFYLALALGYLSQTPYIPSRIL